MPANEPFIIGIDIGGTNLRIGGVTLTGNCLHTSIFPSAVLSQGGDALDRLVQVVDTFRSELGGDNCLGVSIGFPATVAKDRKHVHSVPNILNDRGEHVLDNRNIVDPMEAALGMPVVINRDVNNLLAFDCMFHGLNGLEIIVACYIGTGFGGAIMINGSVLTGKNGVADEIGHIPYHKSERICACGKVACAECYASGQALRLIQKEQFPDTFIGDLFIKHGNEAVLHEFVEDCALPVATQINIFDPDCVVISGGVVSMQGFPRDELRRYIIKHTRKPFPAENLRVIFSEHPKEAGIIGAALSGMKALKIAYDPTVFRAAVQN